MARRQIGQEHLALGGAELRGGASLDAVAALIDWAEIDRLLAGISASAKGEPGWPPLALFKALLLATWHDLSDVRMAEALDDRASFRRFCGFAAHEPTPERGQIDLSPNRAFPGPIRLPMRHSQITRGSQGCPG